jgi:hypothetical protein
MQQFFQQFLQLYGVNKKWKITESNINNVKSTKYVDSSEKIYDFPSSVNFLIVSDLPQSNKIGKIVIVDPGEEVQFCHFSDFLTISSLNKE